MSGDHQLGPDAMALGADAFLPKPVRGRAIVECIAAFG